MDNKNKSYDDLTRRFGRNAENMPGFGDPFAGHRGFAPRFGGPGADFDDRGCPPDFDGNPPRGSFERLPFPPGPHGFAGPDPRRCPEFAPFGEMENYDSLPVEGKLIHRLRGLSHKLQFLSGTLGGQKRILTILAACPGITQRQLMDLTRVRASSLSEVLGKLEAAGQIRRQVCPFDRRTVQVYLTETGETAAAGLKDGENSALFEALTTEEQTALLALVEKLDDAWAKKCPPPPRRAPEEHSI